MITTSPFEGRNVPRKCWRPPWQPPGLAPGAPAPFSPSRRTSSPTSFCETLMLANHRTTGNDQARNIRRSFRLQTPSSWPACSLLLVGTTMRKRTSPGHFPSPETHQRMTDSELGIRKFRHPTSSLVTHPRSNKGGDVTTKKKGHLRSFGWLRSALDARFIRHRCL